MFETNSIIRASAGTGKTFALATRFIRLMLLDRVAPETIVALTFSRAAAQEIYTKILDRLCRAASDGVDAKGRTFAEAEWENLLEDFKKGELKDADRKLENITANPPPHGKDDFARLLRKLVDTQHLGAIATLDSFILKIVRNFPKEMGVQNAVSVLDPIEEDEAIDDAVRSALSTTNGSASEIGDAFIASQKGEYARQCLDAIGNILNRQGWRNFVLAHPECIRPETRWTVANMAARLGVDLKSVCPDLSCVNIDGRHNPAEKFISYAQAYDGLGPIFCNDRCQDLMLKLWKDPSATAYGWTTDKGVRRLFEYGPEGAAAIRAAIRHMMHLYLKRQLEIVEAKLRLVQAVEGEYDRMTRRMGKLTFADFTSYSAEEEFSKRGMAVENVEFRFDAKFDHWALDEFQDTSELQWRCLKELVQSAAEAGHEDDGRTAMAVGDMKQSIYTWRGASARPFDEIASWKAFEGFSRNFSASHRYGPNIADFVNKVFGLGNIRTDGVIPSACSAAVEAWRAGWSDHVSHEAPDYVKVVEAPKDDDPEEDDEILPALHAEIAALWKRHEDEKSVDTVGVLVRNNDKGLAVAEYLRRKGLPAVWEGLSPCGDDPVVQAVLALLKLADHPGDTAAWKTANELIALRPLLLPNCPDAKSASAVLSLLLTQQGFARTLKGWCGAIRDSGKIADTSLTSEKLRQLVACAVEFEERPAGSGDALAFIDFVTDSGKREIASSSEVIRILTIHRSKGLGIDHVFVPLFEGKRYNSAIDAPRNTTPLYDGSDWVLSHLEKGSEQFNERTREAYDQMRSERFAESLRTYYVALTRAKKSMVVVLPQEEGAASVSQGLLMRDLIRSAVGDLPYESGKLPSLKAKEGTCETVMRLAWPAKDTRVRIGRVTPSHGAGHSAAGGRAADLFDEDFGAAVKKGTDAHAAYAKIEWINPDDERVTEFRSAFVKPSPEATVWRERSYELYTPESPISTWETGQFDRVVFTGTGENRSAVIYDFKTNRRREGESAAAFSERMVKTYRSQMSAYRQALNRLTKIPLERIETKLLLVATGESVCA